MRRKALLIGAIVFLLVSVLVATLLVRQNQDNRQRASEEPTATPTPTGPVMDQEEWNFINILNQHRESIGVAPLKVSVKLTTAAEWMSKDMANRGVLSHVDSLGRNINTRLPAFGYQATRIGENVARVGGTGQAAFNAWLASTQGHKEEMEEGVSKAIGIARHQSGNSWFWTADFGTTVDAEITPTETPAITETPTTAPTDTTTPTTDPTITTGPTATTTPTGTIDPTNTPTNSPTPTRTPTPTPTRTPTPTPTRTPTPTNTPTLQPTATTVPTATPLPTATATTVPPSATLTPTSIPATNTSTPTIAQPGGLSQTAGIIGLTLFVIAAGILLVFL